MAIGIIGLAQSGKTTVFNAVTRGHAETAGFRTSGAQPNVGIAKVPDPRLQVLSDLHHSRRIVHAEVEYIDVPAAPAGTGKTQGIAGEFLNALQRCDALLLVARAFQEPSVPHPEGSVDPYRDTEALELELAFSDLSILERRQERIQTASKSAKATERDAYAREAELIQRIRVGLESDIPVRQQTLPAEAKGLLGNFQLLTAKPLMVLFDVGEDDLPRTAEIEAEMAERLGRPGVAATTLCGKLEMELAQMAPGEEAEFRESLGAGEPGLDRMVRLSYGLLSLISFLTTGEDESRAWTIARGTSALDAAAKIHTDIQRGFIRAEVVAYDDLVRTGSNAEARRQAVLRAEGKGYEVRDGDVINFLFNV